MVQSQPIGEALEERTEKGWNSPALSEQLSVGQLWGVTDSELDTFTELLG